MMYVGVDPGKKGAFAIISDDDKAHVDIWDEDRFIYCMKRVSDRRVVAAVEKVGAMPGQGVTSMFSFGQSYGFIMGVLRALGISYQLVPPAVWKREFGLLRADKQASIETCKQLFPGVSLLPGEQCRKDSDGMAEALLIALYAQRKF